MEKEFIIGENIADMVGIPSGTEMELIASAPADSVYPQIEIVMREKMIGPGRRIYKARERRNLIGFGGNKPIAGFLSIAINGLDNEQDETIDTAVFQFCADQRKKVPKGTELRVYYASTEKCRYLLIITPAAKTTCG